MIKVKQHLRADKKMLRQFGVVLAIGLPLMFGLVLPWLFKENAFVWHKWPFVAGAVFAFLAVILPKILIAAYVPWMILADILGFINTRIILGLIYYLIFTPVAIIMKIVKHDPMSRTLDRNGNTYRVINENLHNDLEKPF